MDITWLGNGCFQLRDNEIIAITNPFPDTIGLDMGTLEASVVTISNNREQHNSTNRINGDPSVFNSAGGYDAIKADMWSLGVLLYALLQASHMLRGARYKYGLMWPRGVHWESHCILPKAH